MRNRALAAIRTGVTLGLAVLGSNGAAWAQASVATPTPAPPAQDVRQGSIKVLLATRESWLRYALADEERSKQTGERTWVSFPLPTCVFEGGLCGAINRDGTIAVAPRFDWVDKFHEGRARVRLGGLYGYVDTAGNVVTQPRYVAAGPFRRGFAEVDIDGKSALIDPDGRQVLEPRFARVHVFSDQAFWVNDGMRHYDGMPGQADLVDYVDFEITQDVRANGKWGLVDRTGAWIREPQFTHLGLFDRNDTTLARVKADTGWGVIKPDGTWSIEPRFEALGTAGGTLIPAQLGGKSGYVDRSGQFVIAPTFDRADYFADDGLARASVGKSWGLIDRTGAWVVGPKYDLILHGLKSYGDLYWYRAGDKWGAIDRQERIVVRPQFTQGRATLCDDGWVIGYDRGKQRAVRREDAPLAMPDGDLLGTDCEQPLRIQVGDKFGYLDRTLKPMTDVKFESAREFIKDTAIVKLDGRFGYIRRDGSWLIEPQFEEAHPFHGSSAADEIAVAKLNGKFGCIKRNGAWLIEPRFAENPWGCSHLVTKIAGRFGHMRPDGTWHIDPRLEKIARFGSFDAVKLDGKFGVLDESGAWLIEPRWRSFGMTIREGLVAAKFDEKWGFIDSSGAMIIEPRYDAFSHFQRGISWVKSGNTWCAIDRRGNAVSALTCLDRDPHPKPGVLSARIRG